jgi:hypothetical protein
MGMLSRQWRHVEDKKLEVPMNSHAQDLPVPSTTVRVATTSFARMAATGVAAIVIQIISAVTFSLITISFGTAKEAAKQRERGYTSVKMRCI